MKIFLLLLALSAASFGQGITEISRPNAEADDVTAGLCNIGATNVASTAMPNFYDAGGISTSSALAVSSTATKWEQRKFSGFTSQASSPTYTSLVLTVTSSGATGGAGGGSAGVQYSIDGGGSWSTVRALSTWAQASDSITLSNTQNIASVQVRGCVAGGDGISPGTGTLTGFDIVITGTYILPNAHRTAVTAQ